MVVSTDASFTLDFDADLYGQSLRVELIDHIRPEARFEGAAMLKRQIVRDVIEARKRLG